MKDYFFIAVISLFGLGSTMAQALSTPQVNMVYVLNQATEFYVDGTNVYLPTATKITVINEEKYNPIVSQSVVEVAIETPAPQSDVPDDMDVLVFDLVNADAVSEYQPWGADVAMTYCLRNVSYKAAAMGVCPRVVFFPVGQDYARDALPYFISICNLEPVSGLSTRMPIGTICTSHGDTVHICGGYACGDAKIKIAANEWYGWGISNTNNINGVIGCAAPRPKK